MHFINLVFWPWLQKLDEKIFVMINSKWTNPVFDELMPFLRKSDNWAPLYLFLLVFMLINFRKKAWWWILFFIITVSVTDYIGTRIFKYGFERVRPCNVPQMMENLRLLVPCPSGFGFTSNHAANHFGMATFLFISFRHFFKNWMLLAFVWAGAIAYAQVYVGVHYPMDVICGALWGLVVGTCSGYFYNKWFGIHKEDLPGN
jgi:undecaprenyl-diphosphatase